MIWVVIEDHTLFQDLERLHAIFKKDGLQITLKEKELLRMPTKEDIYAALKTGSTRVILDCLTPLEKLGSYHTIFTTIFAKGENFPYKTIHEEINMPKSKILSDRLALTISEPTATFENYAGASLLHEDIKKMLLLEEMKLRKISALFLFGVAGAGKSYFAECFAGSTGRLFAELDLSHFMTLPNPTRAIDNLFHFLLEQNDKYLLLIDEIEKMFQFDSSSNHLISEQVFGKMLTWLAKLYESKNSNLTFVATANRVEKLLTNKPEFVRKGRFNRLYFLHYPHKERSAPDIFKLYIANEEKYIRNSLYQEYRHYESEEDVSSVLRNFFTTISGSDHAPASVFKALAQTGSAHDVKRIVKVIDGVFQDEKITGGIYFIYTPPEIKSLVVEIFDYYLAHVLHLIEKEAYKLEELMQNKLTLPRIEDVLKDTLLFANPPLQTTAKEGIRTQIAQGSNIKQGDRIAPFTEIH